jgi:hypothetical protein
MAPTPTGRRGSLIARAAIAAALLCAAAVCATPASAASKEVRYGRYAIHVPASWPVYDLAKRPEECVRFDRHAVYLGSPRAEQRCPAHAVGRSEAILVEPQASSAELRLSPSVRAPAGSARPRELPPGGASDSLRVEVPAAGVAVTATWRRHRDVVRRILEGAELRRRGTVPTTQPDGTQRSAQRSTVSRAAYRKGLGFDACTAPSRSAMSAWTSSPYSSVGIYIGGVNRGCSQPNLTPRWVRNVTSTGWALIPIYVGLQAPGSSCGSCAIIKRSQAKDQGRAAARDAIGDARALGMGAGTPIYFDMEHYTRSSTNSRTALRFEKAWTARLHKDGYVSGVYSSASSGIRDLVSRYGSSYLTPDDIWIANWDGRRTTDDPYVPDGYWSNHQRIRQYRGGHNESYRGYTINIDTDYLDGAVFGAADRDEDGVPNDFDLCRRVRGPAENSGCPYPSHVSGGLVDYLDSVEGDRHEGDHFTTTGLVGPAYRFQTNLGFLVRQGQPGTVPLYSCIASGDQFLSRAADCGGTKVLGTIGSVYPHKPSGLPTHAVYRCRVGDTGELAASYDPACDDPANANEGLLGFTISVATLGRYFDSVDGDRNEGDHFTTTGRVAPAYRFQANLGFVLSQRVPGTVPLYSCTADRDQFLSRAATCGGATALGVVGYAYARKPNGLPTHAIYRCRIADKGELTVSYDPECDDPANDNEGLLGFTISVATLGRYLDSVDGDRRKGDHFTTTRGVRAAYHFQSNLGFLLTQRERGTAPLYGCVADGDQFLSRAADCRGAKVRGLMGWIYSSEPAGTPSRAIYRCRRRNGERFTSSNPNCGGSESGNPRRLGYVGISPLPG